MYLLGLQVLERLLLCRDIGSTKRDLTSRECKRHLMDRGKVCVGEGRKVWNCETPPLYTYQIQTPTSESSFVLRKSSPFVSLCPLLSPAALPNPR